MRIFVSALQHESNSFNPIRTGPEDFIMWKGDEIFQHLRPNDALSGMIRRFQREGCQVVAGLSARAVPNGLIQADLVAQFHREILDLARQAHQEAPLDAICLALHGSMRDSQGQGAEGPLLKSLRDAFPQIPIFASLDMHATMTLDMVRACDGFTAYKCAPHTDCSQTGDQAARITLQALAKSPVFTACLKVPFLIAGEKSATDTQPMKGLMDDLRAMEEEPGILSASLLMGFPWADSPEVGVSTLVTATSQAQADAAARKIAEKVWSCRQDFDFQVRALGQNEALDEAFRLLENSSGPIYLSDSGDNPTAGAASDQVDFVRRILADPRIQSLPSPILYGGIYDPKACLACRDKVGRQVELLLGGAFDSSVQAITFKGQVKAFLPDWQRFNYPQGAVALVEAPGLALVVTERHIGYTDPVLFEDLGKDPSKAPIIVVKLGYLTTPHQALAQEAILVLTPGSTNEDLTSIDYKRITRPIYPLDETMTYRIEEYVLK